MCWATPTMAASDARMTTKFHLGVRSAAIELGIMSSFRVARAFSLVKMPGGGIEILPAVLVSFFICTLLSFS